MTKTTDETFYRKLSLVKAMVLCLVIIEFIPTPSFAKDNQLTFVTEHLPPYQIIHNNGEVSGFAVELIHEVAKRSGYQYEINAYPWVRSYNLTKNKPNHCIFSIARIPIREKLFKWVGTITEVNNAVIWGLKEKNIPHVNKLNDLKNYLIAVNKNDVTHLGLLERGFQEEKNLYVLENTNSLIKLLVTRPEVDLIVADDITIAYRAELALVDISLLDRVFELTDLTLNFYLACSINTDQKIINKLKDSLAQLHSDGFYQNVLKNWQKKMVHIK